MEGFAMQDQVLDTEHAELDRLQAAYKAAVDQWVEMIRKEETLASGNHNVAEIDQWEAAGFEEDEARNRVKAAKRDYEDALRHKFFNI
jgi:hypothetical protein